MFSSHTRKAITLSVTLLLLVATLTGCVSTTTQTTAASTAVITGETAETATETTTTQTGESQMISAKEAKKLMDSGADITIVDVREPSEYKTGHIKNAILLPVGKIAGLAATDLPDLNATIIVYCRSGMRSSAAASTLVGLGYTHILDLGGLSNWPYDVVTD